ncbi:MAG: AMP-binding protein [Xanthobacteraceae bacterium]|nr:AMP-binding protein [Xanthobacteraceae bacterium]
MTQSNIDILFDLDADALAALRWARLAQTLDRIFVAHPHYRRAVAELNVSRGDLRSLADIRRLPVTTKSAYMRDPASFQLGPEGAADDEETVVWDVMYTTGSSGAPAPFVSTAYDFVNILALNRNMLRLRGVTAGDSILNLFPLTKFPHGAFIRVLHAASSVNIPVVSAMPGRANPRRPELNNGLDEVVALAARTRPTILWGVPSYIRRLIGRAEEMGVGLPSVRLVFVTGEGFGEEARADMIARLERLGATSPWISVSYGATEMQGGLVECTHGSGYHNPAPDQFLFEAVDPETHEPVADGEEGLILLTHLDRRGTVMLRYALGDVARLARGKCPRCGARTERIVSMPRRVDGLVKIKGMLVNPQALVDAVQGEPSLLDFLAVVEKENPAEPLSMDRLRLRIVPAAGASATLEQSLAARVQRAIGVTPQVERTTADDPLLAGRGWKVQPLLDRRKPKA